MEALAVLAEELQAVRDRSARAGKNPRRLAVGHLGDEGAEEGEIEAWLLKLVVEAKGLGGEGAPTLEAEETLDEAAVAGAEEAAFEAPAVMAGMEGRAVGTRAAIGSETHGSSFLPRARPG
jgi:hypothetical protein